MEYYSITLVVRDSDTRVTVYVPTFSTYTLPALGEESVSTSTIPSDLTTSSTDLPAFLGVAALLIKARTV